MRTRLLICVMVILSGFVRGTQASPSAEFKITVSVLDECGEPVQEARVFGGAWQPGKKRIPRADGTFEYDYDSNTDSNGIVVIQGIGFTDANIMIEKDAYYSSVTRYQFKRPIVDGKFQPYGATNEVVLKKIRNPIPMYVKRVAVKVPAMDKPLGYDLVAGDWVEPYGKGVVTDFLFKVSAEFQDRLSRSVQFNVTCLGDGNGIIETKVPAGDSGPTGSKFWSLHDAPSNGYEQAWEYKMTVGTNAQERVLPEREEKGLILYYRIRSEIFDGQIKSALYGKIYGHITADFDELRQDYDRNVKIYFTYYLNPTPNDRNVEFDPKQNLFKDLKSTEQVTAP